MLLRILMLCCFATVLATPTLASALGQDLLVQFKSNVSKQQQRAITQKIAISRSQQFKHLGGIQYWQLASPVDAKKLIKQLNNNPNVAYAEPNYPRYPRLIANDPSFALQWGLHNTGQFSGSISGMDMSLPLAWDTSTGSANVVVAIIDDAIDINHPDLQANIWLNTAEIAGNNMDDDGNGYIDDMHGWDFVANDNDPSADAGTGEGHGTMVAGCIGAVGNNGLGVTGVNWHVSLMPLKFNFDVASELDALNYAAANGAHIVNASWGGPQFSFAESAGMKALLNSGVLLVAAAGNYDGNNDKVLDYPSSLPYANILAVAAYGINGRLTDWSHFGATTIDVAAPGKSIYTTTTPNTYSYTSGTSFSAPLTAGVAALLLAQDPTLSYQELKGKIMASTDTMSQQALNATDGRVNAARALSIAPQPELVISAIQLSDNNNNLIDPNESIDVSITLENVWQAATGITASLSTTHPLVAVSPASVSWANLAMGAKASATTPFTINTGNLTGFQNIAFTLTISTNNGFTFTRHFNLDSGRLIGDTIYNGQIMQHDQDEFQYYHIDVPAGASLLNITTAGATDIDVLLRFAAPSQFDYAAYTNPVGGHDASTKLSVAAFTGNEQILVNNPQTGTWYATVISYDQQPSSYQIMASTTSAQALVPSIASTTSAQALVSNIASTSSSALCLSPTWLVSGSSWWLLCLLGMVCIQRKQRCSRQTRLLIGSKV